MSFWTEERVEYLLKLNEQGLSASQIAKELTGITRNAVIGKLHRLGFRGLSGEQNNQRVYRPRKRVLTPKPFQRRNESPWAAFLAKQPKATTMVETPANDVTRVALVDLEPHHCRFPVGEPGRDGFGFCGATKVEGLSYCQHHAERCFTQPQGKGWIRPSLAPAYGLAQARIADEFLEKVT